MQTVEILHRYRPDFHVASDVHLTANERMIYEQVGIALDSISNQLAVRAMQAFGTVGQALDLAATVACAGETLCQFMLNRALMNPHELAVAKAAADKCNEAASAIFAKLGTEEQRASDEGREAAAQFLDWAPAHFAPLFEDLEAHARKRFPHLGPQLDQTHPAAG